MQPTMRILLLAAGLAGGWLGGVLAGYVVGVVSVATGGSAQDLTIPILLGSLGAGIGVIVVGRRLRKEMP